MPNTTQELTQSGLSRLYQSIDSRRANEAQLNFITLIEDAIRTPGISKSVEHDQLAIGKAKVHLNFAVATGTWHMPSCLVINTESMVGYSNHLKQAGAGMKLRINNDVNQSTKKAALCLMDRGLQRLTRQIAIPPILSTTQPKQGQNVPIYKPKIRF